MTGGEVLYNGHDLLDMDPDERAREGVFMAFQYPVEIAGVTNAYFLKAALNAKRKHHGQPELDAMEFLQLSKEKAKLLHIDQGMLNRAVNEGFSGGEKKRNEIFQMALLEPTLAILDETDSGLDIDALKVVSDGVNALRSPERAIVVVTHYQRLLNYIVPDFVHVLSGGRIVKSGGKELALELEQKGYGWLEAGEPCRHRRDRTHGTAGREASTVARGARRASARRLALAPGFARSRGIALRRARISDGARRRVALHQRLSDRLDRVHARARRRSSNAEALDDVPVRGRAVSARRRQRPVLAGTVADGGHSRRA